MTDRPPPRAPLGGAQARWPFVAALVGVVVVVAIVVLVGKGTTGSRQGGTGLTASGAVACPRFFEDADQRDESVSPWVPARPAGVHPKTTMVPKLHPTHVTVCAYLNTTGGRPKSLKLSGQHELTGKLDSVVDTLRKLPAAPSTPVACSDAIGPTSSDDYLIGLRYAEAIVWVSAPGGTCAGSGNGVFHSTHSIVAQAEASYRAKRWVSSPS